MSVSPAYCFVTLSCHWVLRKHLRQSGFLFRIKALQDDVESMSGIEHMNIYFNDMQILVSVTQPYLGPCIAFLEMNSERRFVFKQKYPKQEGHVTGKKARIGCEKYMLAQHTTIFMGKYWLKSQALV